MTIRDLVAMIVPMSDVTDLIDDLRSGAKTMTQVKTAMLAKTWQAQRKAPKNEKALKDANTANPPPQAGQVPGFGPRSGTWDEVQTAVGTRLITQAEYEELADVVLPLIPSPSTTNDHTVTPL